MITRYKVLNRNVIKPAIKGDLTDYHVEVEQKRLVRRIAELKFRITKVKQIPIQESLFPDIENLCTGCRGTRPGGDRSENGTGEMLTGTGISSLPRSCHRRAVMPIFWGMLLRRSKMSLDAADVKNRAGYIVEAIRENYQDAESKNNARRERRRLEKRSLKI